MMPIFQCDKCGCIENTALCRFWTNDFTKICSECDPEIGKWHGSFPKQSAVGYLLGSDGFLYHKDSEAKGQNDWRKQHQGFSIVREIVALDASKGQELERRKSNA